MNASPFAIRLLFAHLFAAGLASSSWAVDIVLTPPAGGGVAVNNAAGNATRFRVADDGTVTIPTIAASAAGASGLCVEIATGKVGTCSIGTLTSLAAGTGLSGGTITTSGTLSIAASYQLPQSCANGQIPASNGAGGWACAAPAASSGGTVTSITAGTGLSGGTITGAGTIGLAATQLLPTVACATNQVPKWSGSAWTCAADASGAGTVTSVIAGAGLTGGTITSSGTIAVDPASATLTGAFFKQNGNSFGATASLGTNDSQALEFKANGVRTVRIEPNATSPNVLHGPSASAVSTTYGATIGGGGTFGTIGGGNPYHTFGSQLLGCPAAGCYNRVTDHWGTVGGGVNNQAGDNAGTVGDTPGSTVGGGANNLAIGYASTVAGGYSNTASGPVGYGYGTSVGGGSGNTASGDGATVSGGNGNWATGAFASAGGGAGNQATAQYAVSPGGGYNIASGIGSFAAGTAARTQTGGLNPTIHNGAFVWSDSSLPAYVSFNSAAPNEFAARTTGGARFVTAVNGTSGAPTAGVSLAAGGGSWSSISDRAAKKDLSPIDGKAVLDRLSEMPIYNWRYIEEVSGAMHMGPVAQDFRAAFGLGDSDKTITTIDEGGVALAAIQGLHRIVREQEAKLAEQQAAISNLSARLADAESLKGDLVAVKAVVAELLRDRLSGASRKASLVQ